MKFWSIGLIVASIALTAVAVEERDVDIPLPTLYEPGEPHWAQFGGIDGRCVQMLTSALPQTPVGGFRIPGEDDDDEPIDLSLRLDFDTREFFGEAASRALVHYGICIQNTGAYRLIIRPLRMRIWRADPDIDGEKSCVISMWVEFFRVADSTRIVRAFVSNKGVDQCDDENGSDYADLVARTVHGALVKLWASGVLEADTSIGLVRIIKKQRGVIGYVPLDTAAENSDMSNEDLVSLRAVAVAVDSALAPGMRATLVGASAVSDSIDISGGKRIAVGLLPFQNATGRSELTALAVDVRESLINNIARSATIRIVERDRLEDILKEQALGLSGIMNDSSVVRVGNLMGARAMIDGRVTTSGGYYRLSARVINVETSSVVAAASVLAPDAVTMPEASAELAALLVKGFTGEKLAVNRSTISYPPPCVVSIPARAAASDDAWAVETNPACLMKIRQRDAAFHFSAAEQLNGTVRGEKVSATQPPYSDLGLNLAVPIGSRFAGGIGIGHRYTFPQLDEATLGIRLKEEETILTLPFALGVNPKFSLGVNIRLHILEYSLTAPGYETQTGSALYGDAMVGTLIKISPKFRIGATLRPERFFMDATEERGGTRRTVSRNTPYDARLGVGMYPRKWFAFFGDLQYEKQAGNPRLQPGFHLGAQLTWYGRIFNMPFTPQYGMLPLSVGYSHTPYRSATNTQAKYLSIGAGYVINNVYVRWSLRASVASAKDKQIVIGLPGNGDSNVRVDDYSLLTPIFVTVGYRF